MSNAGAGRHCDELRITHQHRARRCRDNHTGSMLRAAPLLLAAVVSLDFAYQSSVDAFLPAPSMLRGIARDKCPCIAGRMQVCSATGMSPAVCFRIFVVQIVF